MRTHSIGTVARMCSARCDSPRLFCVRRRTGALFVLFTSIFRLSLIAGTNTSGVGSWSESRRIWEKSTGSWGRKKRMRFLVNDEK